MPFNASGVVQVGPDRFVFVDNNDPSASFELALLPDGTLAERISRRPLVGVAEGQLLDPEGLSAVDLDGEAFLVAASSLCVRNGNASGRQRVNDGLVRIRYTPGVTCTRKRWTVSATGYSHTNLRSRKPVSGNRIRGD